MVAKSLLKGLGLALVVALAIGAGAALGEGSGHEVTVAPQVTKVPDVVGLAPPKANRALSRHHLRHRYTALSNLCAGLPPAGHVLLQDPKAGTWVEERSLVRLQTSCAKSQRGSTIRPWFLCPPRPNVFTVIVLPSSFASSGFSSKVST